jgi:signal transduction histidine kinase
LNITRSLVEAQGGRIWFESVFREGTTFHFTIPVAE